MSSRRLVPVPVDPGPSGVDALLPRVAEALQGGEAVLPVPADAPYDAATLFCPDEPLEHDAVAAVVATSGSTGSPKGVLLSADALLAAASATQETLGGPGQWLIALPPASIAGFMQLIRSILAGTTPVAVDPSAGFTAEAFVAATSQLGHGRRYTSLVPAQLTRLMTDPAAGEELTTFDAVLVGGAASDPALLHAARAAGVRLVLTYGSTETSGGCVYDGTPLPGTEVRIGEHGRIAVRGPTLFSGYRLRPDLTAQTMSGDWLITQDRGRWTGEGRLEVLGRLDDVVITGGVNVDLAAVEAALAGLPVIAEAAVVAVPDPEWGVRIVAVVVAREAGTGLLAAVRDHVRDRLGAPAAPRAVVEVGALPRLPSGKTDRRACEALAAAA